MYINKTPGVSFVKQDTELIDLACIEICLAGIEIVSLYDKWVWLYNLQFFCEMDSLGFINNFWVAVHYYSS